MHDIICLSIFERADIMLGQVCKVTLYTNNNNYVMIWPGWPNHSKFFSASAGPIHIPLHSYRSRNGEDHVMQGFCIYITHCSAMTVKY